MMRHLAIVAVVLGVAFAAGGCASDPGVRLTEDWPTRVPDYDGTTTAWTRIAVFHSAYQQVLQLAATFKSADWRAAHALHESFVRGLTPEARDQQLAAAQADAAGPYEVELMVTTWDRRENDLDRGKRSVWHVALIDDQGNEVAPLEIVKDKRPGFVVRAEFPAFGDFATAYVAKFPRTAALFGPTVRQVRLRMSSERGGVELSWNSR